MRQIPNILLVDDDEDDYILARDLLTEIYGGGLNLSWISEAEQGLAAIVEAAYDIFLVDYRLGEQDGIELIRKGVAAGCKAPIILLTGQDSREIDLQAMSAGAVDYLVKGQITAPLLDKAIRYAIARQGFLRTKVEANELLRKKNKKLADLYDTAHQFVENVSHEFRTPLTVIKEYASIIQDGLGGEVTEDQDNYLGIIIDRVEDLTVMVNDMLDTSRLEAGLLGVSRAERNVALLVEHIRPSLERKAVATHSSLEIAIADDLPSVYCDSEKIGRVLINLVVNAFKFVHEGGQVTVWARHDPLKMEVTVGVTDNGPGIASDQLKIIFERFEQLDNDVRTSTKGFGLGLNIAKELVQINFGEMSVESTVGEGSTFSFTIPTFQVAGIVDRYLKRVEYFRNGSSFVSLICLQVPETANSDQIQEAEGLLQHSIRQSDLLFSKTPNSWLAVAASNQLEIEIMIGRLGQIWSDANRNRLGDGLPPLSSRLLGTWKVSDQREQFVARFEEEIRTTTEGTSDLDREELGIRSPGPLAQCGAMPSGA